MKHQKAVKEENNHVRREKEKEKEKKHVEKEGGNYSIKYIKENVIYLNNDEGNR